jgi:hypothetical protein
MSSTYETRGMRVIMDPHGSAWIRKGGQECVSIQRFKHLWTLDMCSDCSDCSVQFTKC